MTRWKRTLRTFLAGFVLPFVLLAIFLDMAISMNQSDSQNLGHELMDGDGG